MLWLFLYQIHLVMVTSPLGKAYRWREVEMGGERHLCTHIQTYHFFWCLAWLNNNFSNHIPNNYNVMRVYCLSPKEKSPKFWKKHQIGLCIEHYYCILMIIRIYQDIFSFLRDWFQTKIRNLSIIYNYFLLTYHYNDLEKIIGRMK